MSTFLIERLTTIGRIVFRLLIGPSRHYRGTHFFCQSDMNLFPMNGRRLYWKREQSKTSQGQEKAAGPRFRPAAFNIVMSGFTTSFF